VYHQRLIFAIISLVPIAFVYGKDFLSPVQYLFYHFAAPQGGTQAMTLCQTLIANYFSDV
jgi:hypothetical protein